MTLDGLETKLDVLRDNLEKLTEERRDIVELLDLMLALLESEEA